MAFPRPSTARQRQEVPKPGGRGSAVPLPLWHPACGPPWATRPRGGTTIATPPPDATWANPWRTGGNGLCRVYRDVPRHNPLHATSLLRAHVRVPACVRDWGRSRHTAVHVQNRSVNIDDSCTAVRFSIAVQRGTKHVSSRYKRAFGVATDRLCRCTRIIAHPRCAAQCRRKSDPECCADGRQPRARPRPDRGRRSACW